MSGEMDGSLMEGEEAEAEETKKPQAEVELVDSRPKKLTGIELIKENVKELHEVIAYMDYSFERAFTIQEKQFMLAYKVSGFKLLHFNCPVKALTDTMFVAIANRNTQKRFNMTSMISSRSLKTQRNVTKKRRKRLSCSSSG